MNAPVIVLVEPQLPQNIGMAARAMTNFGLSELRLVTPREGWPNEAARGPAAGADAVIDGALLFRSLRDAVGDLQFVLATTARPRGQMKRVLGPAPAVADLHERATRGERVGIVFGRERSGLENDEVSLADAVVTFPVSPDFASLNLAQSVLLLSYEWARGGPLPVEGTPPASPPASRASLLALFDHLEGELDAIDHYPPDKRPIMIRNMRDMFHRMGMSEQDVRTFRGAIRAISGRRVTRKP